ncbi:sigma-54 interaction domain-containing protein [Candidatus Magnetomonas plexicatena]|uniref:sigma-54 interaction domain-containing protein n=1 Tax=Candidatus Magnetomonas plexicatena TaxID=2552947 RepID=UPI001C77AB4F|nr:sigma-54-dependent Fis family transcriptional regulator [Nitrospirales bacterium LBB_01]
MKDEQTRTGFYKLIGKSQEMQRLYSIIEKVASSDSTILIMGESGTGKELVAKAIHYLSVRAENPFVPVNCGAIPKELLESELFGHEKGAFTGAICARKGRFELAETGTIFLDEIGELHPSLQVKLLRVLQEREYERVGGVKTVKGDVRILAATNKNLEEATKRGEFREDLYYRLNVIPVKISPLRNRKEDIPILRDHFIKIYSDKRAIEPLQINNDAMEFLMKYNWPGNVRELETLIERFTILTENGVVTVEDLPDRFSLAQPHTPVVSSGGISQLPSEGIDLNSYLDDIETSIILQALERSQGVKSKAAALLGLNRTTFIEKLKKKGIDTAKHGDSQ